jgi:hypothetical protein
MLTIRFQGRMRLLLFFSMRSGSFTLHGHARNISRAKLRAQVKNVGNPRLLPMLVRWLG